MRSGASWNRCRLAVEVTARGEPRDLPGGSTFQSVKPTFVASSIVLTTSP